MPNALQEACRKLRLSGLASTLEVRLEEAASHQLAHAQFLELVFQDELLIRQQRLLERRKKVAHFRDLKPLEDFDWNFSTLLTSNRPIEEWGQLLGDVPAATAILDRFLQQAEIIQISGRSYRLRNASGLAPAEKGKKAQETAKKE